MDDGCFNFGAIDVGEGRFYIIYQSLRGGDTAFSLYFTDFKKYFSGISNNLLEALD